MSAKDNGGPAFVFPGFEFFDTRVNSGEGERVVYEPHKGMSLRDYFAAKAMQGMRAGDYKYRADLANDAYAMADAMIAERAK